TLSCTGPGGATVNMVSVSVRLARLSWVAPTQYVDGTTIKDLTGYKVYWGASPHLYTQSANAAGASFDVALTAGTWYFAVTALTTSGGESDFSNEVTKTVN